MGVDWPDEAAEPSEEKPQVHNERPAPAETRSRQEYYADLHEAVSAQQTAATRQDAAEEQAATRKWDRSAEESRWMWREYQRKWPLEEGSPTSKRSPGERFSPELERACDRIAQREREVLSPAMRDIESRDESRKLIGFEHRLKNSDRIMEKAAGRMEEKGRTPEQAVSLISDAIRYTFQYEGARYTQGVWSDIARLKEHGFEMVKCKNFWTEEQYKGINSQWLDPNTGQRFEVQFHTRISFEAKQLTHGSYERLRTGHRDEFERLVLKAFQRKVSAEVPVPLGAADVPDYPEGRRK